MTPATIFSPCRTWRYSLYRPFVYAPKNFCAFVCLNPSTADEVRNDPTVTRCIGYSKAWGYDAFMMLNIFAYRATDPRVMRAAADPVGPDNDATLDAMIAQALCVVAAWGTHGDYLQRGAYVRRRYARKLCALRITKHGAPSHPLYLPANLTPEPWQ